MGLDSANVGMSGDLSIEHARDGRAVEVEIPTPFSRARIFIVDAGKEVGSLADLLRTNLTFTQFRPSKTGANVGGAHFELPDDHPMQGVKCDLIDGDNLGSGLVTNAGVNLMANEVNNMTAATPFATLNSMNFHRIGTGATAAAASDYYVQTPIASGSLTGTTNGYMTGTQAMTTPNTLKSTATFTLNATLAVTEWGITMSNATNFGATSTGTPTSTALPDSGASFTNSGNKLAGWTVETNSTAINTSPTTTTMGLVTVGAGNSATNLVIANGWWHLDNSGPASTPGVNTAYVVYPTLFDRKVFSAINGIALDTIQFAWSLAINSGG